MKDKDKNVIEDHEIKKQAPIKKKKSEKVIKKKIQDMPSFMEEVAKIKQEEALTLQQPYSIKGSIGGRKLHIGLEVRIAFWAFILAVLTILGAIFFINGLKNDTTYRFFYTETSNLDYKVCLKENNYFKDKCLGKGKQYIASIIETINTDFKYIFNASDVFDYDYTYYTTATLVATEKNDPTKILYGPAVEQLTEEKTISRANSNSFVIMESLEIDYIKYNAIMTNFRKDYTLLFDSKIVITLVVNVEGKSSKLDDKISSKQEISVSIPLSEQTVNVLMDYKDVQNDEMIKNDKTNNLSIYMFNGLGIVCAVLVILVFLKLTKLISKILIYKKTNYQKALEKILREYDQIIINTKKMPEVTDISLTEVETFEELLDVRNVIQKPISYVKIHNEKSWFITNDGNAFYRYIMKAIDFEKESK